MMTKRLVSLLGALMAGDATAFLLDPRGQIRLWSSPRAPRWYRRAMNYFDEHARLCRTLAVAELAAAALLLRHAQESG